MRRNLSTKRLTWRTSGVSVKNAFELKNARRVLVEGNTFEHVWPSGAGRHRDRVEVGQPGRPLHVVRDRIRDVQEQHRPLGGARAADQRRRSRARAALRCRSAPTTSAFRTCVFRDIGGREWGGGKLFRVFGGVSDVEITHVTSTGNSTGNPRPARHRRPEPEPRCSSYNIVERNLYGIGAGGRRGITTVTRNFAPFVYNQNVLVNTSRTTNQAISDAALKSRYPPVTTIVSDWTAVGFIDGTEKLTTTSPYYPRRRRWERSRRRSRRRDRGAGRPAEQRPVRSGARPGCPAPVPRRSEIISAGVDRRVVLRRLPARSRA